MPHNEPIGLLALCSPVTDREALGIANDIEVALAEYGFANEVAPTDRLSGALQRGLVAIIFLPARWRMRSSEGTWKAGSEGGAEAPATCTLLKTITQRCVRL